jgi:hypothetical protein
MRKPPRAHRFHLRSVFTCVISELVLFVIDSALGVWVVLRAAGW